MSCYDSVELECFFLEGVKGVKTAETVRPDRPTTGGLSLPLRCKTCGNPCPAGKCPMHGRRRVEQMK